MNQFSKLTISALAVAALLFAGCAKKEVVSNDTPAASTHAVSTMVKKPTSNSVYFAYDSSALDDASKAALDAHAAWLASHTAKSVTIEGNCDQRGSREYNLALGQRRADSVKDYLVSQGADASHIDTVSFGEERPACTGSGEACWAQNRHADIAGR
ncbi:MAG: peptidoglycan-associated lipoprotein Pal [Mariprofundaceae bacterium]